jgi:hypothetical protein
LVSLGAREMSRNEFLELVRESVAKKPSADNWNLAAN